MEMSKNNGVESNELREKKKKDIPIRRMLKYSAAALSVMSFITTAKGMNNIVTDSFFASCLISFGIQSVILVLGLQFIDVCKATIAFFEQAAEKQKLQNEVSKGTIKKQHKSKLMYVSVGLMIFLYASSIAFSSFYSFVYLSDVAYQNVKISDYNVDIEKFLVRNTNEVRSIVTVK
ncbi:MAG: hypothetical protein J6A30_05215 [Ruminococcus sp.]|nr:hypothetical protein [Ruminococcus sp.]